MWILLATLAHAAGPAATDGPVKPGDATGPAGSVREAKARYRAQGLVPPTPAAPWGKVQLSRAGAVTEVIAGPVLFLGGWLDGNIAAVNNEKNDGQWTATAVLMGGGFEMSVNGATRLVLTKRWRSSLEASAWGVAPGRYPTPDQAARAFHLGMAISNGATGAFIAAGGIGLLGMSSSLTQRYPDQPDGDYARETGITLVTEGALCIATGAVQLLTMDHHPTAVSLAPLVDGRHAGMLLGGTF